jgi:hypothetical protein
MEATPNWPPPRRSDPSTPSSPSTWTVPDWTREEKKVSRGATKVALILRALLPFIALVSGTTIWAINRNQGPSWNLAKEIGLRQSDFPAGTTIDMTQPAGPNQPAPSASGPCSPVHSQPWTSDYDSPTFDPSGHGNDFVTSEVVIMPSAGDAYTAQHAIGSPGYGVHCFQPAYDAASKEMMPDLSCGAFHFDSSSIVELPNDGFPEATVDYRYTAVMSCTRSQGVYTWCTDIVSAQVGAAFIQGIFNSYGGPLPTSIEQNAMNAMANRAYSHLSAQTADGEKGPTSRRSGTVGQLEPS